MWRYMGITASRLTMLLINAIIIYIYMITIEEVNNPDRNRRRKRRIKWWNRACEAVAEKILKFLSTGRRTRKKNKGNTSRSSLIRRIVIVGALLMGKSVRKGHIMVPEEIHIQDTLMDSQAQDDRWVNELDVEEGSGRIGIDNRASACISHSLDDFTGPMREVHRTIKGFGGTRTMGTKMGTIIWRWMDDQGRVHRHTIPNSYYIPEGKVRLLSPQHWAQTRKNKVEKEQVTARTTYDKVILMWGKERYKLTVPLGMSDNVATINMAPGYSKCDVFLTELGQGAQEVTVNSALLLDEKEEDHFRATSSNKKTCTWEQVSNWGQQLT